jgi:hypothetical protein
MQYVALHNRANPMTPFPAEMARTALWGKGMKRP